MRRGVAGGGHRQIRDEVVLSQVLARKYRPRNFDQLIGQDHVAQALTNALTNDRLHHAYLFVGTRGVGKTSIARILARCLNCDTGPTPTPCLTCSACQSIEAGRFVDLIEVDAASRTKVEDTRELLENVQYAPSEGRFKVYLIDEVHMLSGHSFNALLKTLEEPPAHVKFILATTDPQKVPMTVLSRCLQFRLRDLPSDRIAEHLANILNQESLSFESEALDAIGRAARGSIRDALTLTDQAIAFTDGQVQTAAVQQMLGIQGQEGIHDLIAAIASGDAQAALDWVNAVAQVAPDWLGLIEVLQRALHEQALAFALGQSGQNLMSAEVIQLNYQLATQAYQELPLAPEPKLGFEMLVLRMLAFRPAGQGEYPAGHSDPEPGTPDPKPEGASEAPAAAPESPSWSTQSEPVTAATEQPLDRPEPIAESAPENVAASESAPANTPVPTPVPTPVDDPSSKSGVDLPWHEDSDQEQERVLEPELESTPALVGSTADEQNAPDLLVASPETIEPTEPTLNVNTGADVSAQAPNLGAEYFTDLLTQAGLDGMALSIARQGELIAISDGCLTLRLPADNQSLFMDHHQQEMLQKLSSVLAAPVHRLVIDWSAAQGMTPNDVLHQREQAALVKAQMDFQSEPTVNWLQSQFDATIDSNSVKPRSE